MGEELGLLKLLPEGVSVTSVMLTLVFGIKYVKYLHNAHKNDKQQLADSHKSQIQVLMESHKEERDRFSEVLTEANSTSKELMLSHKNLMEEHLKMSGEMVTAVKGLEGSIRELQQKVK